MARRRYLSTDISTDTKVNKLAAEAGDFAVILYTWMIPHASDDATLTGDPEELLLRVCPGRRDKTADDVAEALDCMNVFGLIVWDQVAGVITFPESFYRHQSYIGEKRRKSPQPEPAPEPDEPSAQNAADHRESAENRASFKSSFKSSSSSSSSSSEKDDVRSDKPTAPPNAPFALFQAFCQERGIDEADVPRKAKDKQLGIAKRLAIDYGEADVVACIRFLSSQGWRTAPWDLATVESQIGTWVMNGRPSTEPPRVTAINGRKTRRDEVTEAFAEFDRLVGTGTEGDVIEAKGTIR